MSSPVPLSLRRKIVIALDGDHVAPPTVAPDTESSPEHAQNRFLSFKTVAWCKANLVRPNTDHVFLITAIDPIANTFDGGVISTMWNSLVGTQDPHVDRVKEAEAALRRLAEALHATGVSCTIEVLRGPVVEMVREYVHVHRGEILAVQVVGGRSKVAEAVAYAWPELVARDVACPTVLVKTSDLPENIATALDPPLPTATTEDN
ncbi:hypothetical protein IWW38_003247 [Coemansia aciculifera]|uniref:Uncharacterized protein n=1 Tax=Coemansia aciculifera TaxID=417176 RepID=A0ACC1M1Z9_9FUNG|nr:hypothetical protein IWW38_003247 [Coemansia aciculifera]